MISSVTLKLSPASGQPPLAIPEPSVTIFVGPNNSGKSTVLREIEKWCVSGPQGTRILAGVEFERISESAALSEIADRTVEPHSTERASLTENRAMIQINGSRILIKTLNYVAARMDPQQHPGVFANYCSRPYTLNLDGASRMQLVGPKDRGDLKNPTTTFAKLLTSNAKREALRTTLHDAFGMYVGIDMSEGGSLQLRFGQTSPPNERTVEEDTLAWMGSALGIADVSDGIKAFTGILVELSVGEPKIIIIDEPEAFLHPVLAYKLGQEVAKLGNKSGQHVFVSTHSAQFLMGAVQSGARVNIVRLTYRAGSGAARLLPNNELSVLMKDPLLRSSNAMSGLFYENVIVAEADADRAFYQEINDRMTATSTGRGIGNALFLNGNGKDSLYRMVAPMRQLGIPCAAVFDVDFLRGGPSWKTTLAACLVPVVQRQALSILRADTWKALEATGVDPKANGGISLLLGEQLAVAKSLIAQLEEYGIFVLQHGEVENWLPELGVTTSQKWLHSIFSAMGDDPSKSEYLRPSTSDVWAFIDRIGAWMRDAAHKGLPAS